MEVTAQSRHSREEGTAGEIEMKKLGKRKRLQTAAIVALATVTLVVAGRSLSRSLTPPSRASRTAVTATATSGPPPTTLAPAAGSVPVPGPRHGRLVAARAGRAGWTTYVDKIDRLSVTIPAGWSAKPDPIAELVYPDPVLAVGSWPFPIDPTGACAPVRAVRALPADGVLLWLLESGPTADAGLFDPSVFPPRPGSFQLEAMRPRMVDCTDHLGYVLRFRDRGRYFSVEIVLGMKAPRSSRAVLEQVLQSLRLT